MTIADDDAPGNRESIGDVLAGQEGDVTKSRSGDTTPASDTMA